MCVLCTVGIGIIYLIVIVVLINIELRTVLSSTKRNKCELHVAVAVFQLSFPKMIFRGNDMI